MPLLFAGTPPDYRNPSDATSLQIVNPSSVILVKDQGVATLVGGKVTVASTSAVATSTFVLSYYSLDGTVSTLAYANIVPGVSFDILSGNSGDTNKVSWAIL